MGVEGPVLPGCLAPGASLLRLIKETLYLTNPEKHRPRHSTVFSKRPGVLEGVARCCPKGPGVSTGIESGSTGIESGNRHADT